MLTKSEVERLIEVLSNDLSNNGHEEKLGIETYDTPSVLQKRRQKRYQTAATYARHQQRSTRPSIATT